MTDDEQMAAVQMLVRSPFTNFQEAERLRFLLRLLDEARDRLQAAEEKIEVLTARDMESERHMANLIRQQADAKNEENRLIVENAKLKELLQAAEEKAAAIQAAQAKQEGV